MAQVEVVVLGSTTTYIKPNCYGDYLASEIECRLCAVGTQCKRKDKTEFREVPDFPRNKEQWRKNMGNNIEQLRETCGQWDEEMGCSAENAEQECPFYAECKDHETQEVEEEETEEDENG